MIVSVQLAMTPPSLNQVGARGNPRHFHRVKRQWQKWLELTLMGSSLPRGCEHVSARAVLTFPTSRGRDEGNYRALLEKALGDALQAGRWIENDTPEHYTFPSLTFAQGPAATTITLEHR